jgi:hypothetical protein
MALIDFSLSDVGSLFTDIRAAITGKTVLDPQKALELELKVKELEQNLLSGQIEINKLEAQHSSVFVAGWRPFIGWIGAIGLGMEFIIKPLMEWTSALAGTNILLPNMNSELLFNLILALLGLAGFRSFDKLKGIDTKVIK